MRSRIIRSSLILAATSMTGGILSQSAQAEVVGACSGVRLPQSAVTSILGNVLVPVLAPVESLLSGLTFGAVNLGLANTLSSAASGAPINLGAININGGEVDLLTNPGCNSQADAFTLNTPKGLSIGGNNIAGLGQTGLGANAGELDAIAIGDLATTSVGASRAIAFGAGASASHAGSVALGAGSVANGSTLGMSAYLVGGTAAAEVNIGARRITGLAAGANPTDAVNVAQLTNVHDAVTGLSASAVQYDNAGKSLVSLQGASGTRITNVAAGAVNAASSDAVNGAQLHATNNSISQVGSDLSVLDGAAVKYQNGTRADVVFGGASGTRLSNVAAGIATDDAANVGQLNAVNTAVTNVANSAVSYDGSGRDLVTMQGASGTRITNVTAGSVNATSMDAVNGAQLHATNNSISQVGADLSVLDGAAVKYQNGTRADVVFGGASGTRLSNVAAGIANDDAANVGQLNAVNTAVTNVANSAVSYDGSGRDLVTMQGASGTRITNVTAGAVNATSMDAVNGAQLHATNTNVAQLSMDLSVLDGLSVKYQDGTRSAVAFGGASGTRLSNVAAGVANDDAVNVGQLNSVSAAVTGLASNAVSYDDAGRNVLTMQGANGTRITNVAAGTLNASSTDAVNGSQLHATNVSVTQLGYDVAALDGMSVKYQDGTRTAVTFGGSGGTRLSNVAAGVAQDDAANVGQLTALAAAVGGVRDDSLRYDSVSNSYSAVRSGTPTRISGVAAGTVDSHSSDAVNGAQLAATNAAVSQNTATIGQVGQDVAALDAVAVKYQDSSRSALVLAGTNGTRVSNVAAGVADGDAVNVAQLNAVSTSVGSVRNEALLYDGSANAYNAARGGTDQRVTGVAAGTVSAGSSDAVNGAQLAETNTAVSRVGQRADSATASIANHLGGGATVQADGSISAPRYAVSTVAADGARSTTAYTSVGDALSGLGTSVANVNERIDSVAAVNERAVAYDGAPGSARDTVTFAGTQGTVLANVRAGEISATSTEAVTGAQLHATNSQLASSTTIVNALRDGTEGYAQVNNSGGFAKPSATGANSMAGGAGSVASGAGTVALGTQAQAIAANSVAVGYGSVADRANSLSVGSEGAERQITNVADATSMMDAVNMRQLQGGMNETLLTANAYTDSRFEQLGADMYSLHRNANAGTAASMALSALPQPIEAGRGMLGFGTSIWQGETAIAMGFSRASDNGRLIVKAGATYNSRKQGGANAGVGIAF